MIGPPGSGKSDLALRLRDRGFSLVADDRVDIRNCLASAPESLAGLLEVRGLGIVRLPFVANVRLALVVQLGEDMVERLPQPAWHSDFNLPMIRLNALSASAPDRVALALDCALGRVQQIAGTFAA